VKQAPSVLTSAGRTTVTALLVNRPRDVPFPKIPDTVIPTKWSAPAPGPHKSGQHAFLGPTADLPRSVTLPQTPASPPTLKERPAREVPKRTRRVPVQPDWCAKTPRARAIVLTTKIAKKVSIVTNPPRQSCQAVSHWLNQPVS